MVLAADHRTPSIGLVFSSGDGEAQWLCDVDFLPQIAVEEARLHIHVASFLVQPQLAGAHGLKASHRHEHLIEVNALLLHVALGDEASLVLDHSPNLILLELDPLQPSGAMPMRKLH